MSSFLGLKPETEKRKWKSKQRKTQIENPNKKASLERLALESIDSNNTNYLVAWSRISPKFIKSPPSFIVS